VCEDPEQQEISKETDANANADTGTDTDTDTDTDVVFNIQRDISKHYNCIVCRCKRRLFEIDRIVK
jgi:hypothetical protein